MTPEQHREHDEFCKLRLQIFRQMFPVAHAMLQPGRRVTDSIPVDGPLPYRGDPGGAHAAFKAAVDEAWRLRQSRKRVADTAPRLSTGKFITVADIQRMNAAAYDDAGNFVGNH